MGAAEDAYAAALEEIARVKAAGGTELDLSEDRFAALNRLPPELTELTALQSLRLDGTRIADISHLTGLNELKVLWLNHTQVTDVTPLGDLTVLRSLDLSDTQVADISPLAGLIALQSLRLAGTPVADFSPLSGLKELQALSLESTKIEDISPLSCLTMLQVLLLDRTQVADISPLASIPGLQSLYLTRSQVADISPLAGLSALQSLWLDRTQIVDISPLAGLTALQLLGLNNTLVADVSPLSGLPALESLGLDGTQVADITPLAGLTALNRLKLSGTHVIDLRPLRDLAKLGESETANLWFHDTPALRDPELARLSAIEDDQTRTSQTLAYLRTLPPWPEPLPYGAEQTRTAAPAPDPALPLQVVDGAIDLLSAPLERPDDDPLRAALFDELEERVKDLIRISANQDDGIYREACRLRDRLHGGLSAMEPVRVHLCIETLRRAHRQLAPMADRDMVQTLAVVLDIGPGLTLGTPEVTLLLDRIRENQLLRRDQAEIEAETRLAEAIAESPLAAQQVASLARAAADGAVEDQFSGLRTPLVRNWLVILATSGIMQASVQGVVGNASYEALKWLAANADDALIIARFWGEPVMSWLVPILHRAREMTEAGRHLAGKVMRS
ncbi:leucine-rich repeat domain-containing protein [Roseicyclus mahoneyensis]|uniref:Leucine-rich repeat (LRR) protein n=1 Tax=Roseicyclus mahoneyensis TaxID=164332 RepID=A0A316GNK7_9RHOB|nr:leucine-rich repeat domain-containing protein [Roseicyclus mahoneyensis]PWK62740.1 Leucine-rich repeat (LRR) protein [Roseicyclus mahoneyensis]